MTARPGDHLHVPSEKVGQTERIGEIVEVLGDRDHPFYKVRWADKHETIVAPGPDSRIEVGRAQAAKS